MFGISPVAIFTPASAALPVLVSVPHAGCHVPADILAAARVDRAALGRLSDAWSDLLAVDLAAAGATLVGARLARAVADCNRAEMDLDPVDAAPDLRQRLAPPGRKARAGLGVVPTRLAGVGMLWRAPIDCGALEARLDAVHRPFHSALASQAQRLLRRFGMVLLLDLHSMPALPSVGRAGAPRIVIGDDHGRSCAAGLAAHWARLARDAGYGAAVNAPYAGGYIIRRHGHPGGGVQAVQIECDRSLYLDAEGLPDQDGVAALSSWLVGSALQILAAMQGRAGWDVAAE